MPQLFAAVAPHVLEMLALGLELSGILILVFIVLALVLGELASGLVLAPLSAAPPHLSAVDTSMSPATPVEVFFLVVFLCAMFAHFDTLIDLTLSALELDDPLLHLVSFG